MIGERIESIPVDCEQCLKEETVTGPAPVVPLPKDWIEIQEGPPFNNRYQFCSPECFTAWHARDKNERLTKYHTRLRARKPSIQGVI
jgi:hypothetical protein